MVKSGLQLYATHHKPNASCPLYVSFQCIFYIVEGGPMCRPFSMHCASHLMCHAFDELNDLIFFFAL